MKRLLLRSLFILFCFLPVSSFAQEPDYIRVAILQNASSARLKIKGPFEVKESSSGKVIFRGNNLNATVVAYKDGILLGNTRSRTEKLLVKCSQFTDIFVNTRPFHGDIEFVKDNNSKLLAVNYINLQDYIKGILYNEVSHYWPIEALKAQAIVSRSFAVYQIQESKARNFDVTNDIYSQVYGGQLSERHRTNKAVDETAGEVLFYKDNIFPAFFHATCAGSTEDVSLLWNIDLFPLKGVTCGFCKESPHHSWHYDIPLKEIEEKLSKGGFKVESITAIVAAGKTRSGRVMNLRIISAGNEVKISAKDFRNIIGPNFIRSTNFNVSVAGEDAVFEGLGWGHGVGLCQWGAYFMAKRGDSVEKILKHYYPGAYVKTL